MFLAHTNEIPGRIEGKECRCIRKGDAKTVLKSYGYTNVNMNFIYARIFSNYIKPEKNGNENKGESNEKAQEPVDAIVGIMNPATWDRVNML